MPRHTPLAPVRRHGRRPRRRDRHRPRRGRLVWDADGNRYLDGTASLWYANVGHGRAEIADAVARADARAASLLALRRLRQPRPRWSSPSAWPTSPRSTTPRIFLGSGGGDAIDTAAKLARRYFAATGQPERVHLISPHAGLPRHPRRSAPRSAASRPTATDVGPAGPDASLVPTTRSRRSRTRSRASAPSASPRSSSSRSSAPAACTSRRPATSRASPSCARAPACCSSSTPSSAASAGSAPGSASSAAACAPT